MPSVIDGGCPPMYSYIDVRRKVPPAVKVWRPLSQVVVFEML
jgi:hypothetical protein